jgi:hypothetical protein
MDENLVYYLQIQFFRGYSVEINKEIGKIRCPKLYELEDDLFYYIFYFNKFIKLYETDKNNFYLNLFKEQSYSDFMKLIFYMTGYDDIKLTDEGKFMYNKGDNFIFSNNVDVFMNIVIIMHHCEETGHMLTKGAKKHMEEVKKRKEALEAEFKKLKRKIKQDNGIGFLEIMSTVSARHPSINPININELNYYQVVNQYKKLLKIDDWNVVMNSYSNGNLDEKQTKKIRHYSEN